MKKFTKRGHISCGTLPDQTVGRENVKYLFVDYFYRIKGLWGPFTPSIIRRKEPWNKILIYQGHRVPHISNSVTWAYWVICLKISFAEWQGSLGQYPDIDACLLAQYLQFCKKLGILPATYKRTYISQHFWFYNSRGKLLKLALHDFVAINIEFHVAHCEFHQQGVAPPPVNEWRHFKHIANLYVVTLPLADSRRR